MASLAVVNSADAGVIMDTSAQQAPRSTNDEEAGAILDFLRSLGTNIKDYIKNPTTERQKERAKEKKSKQKHS